jgi:MPBQ/MSBQ methyltransferase
VRFGVAGLLKSLREVPTLLLMRLAFGTGLCRFGMFRAVRSGLEVANKREEANATAK